MQLYLVSKKHARNNELNLQVHICSNSYTIGEKEWITPNFGSKESEAGQFVGLADFYAVIVLVIVLADNATFLLAVNHMVAFWPSASNQ